MSRNGVPEAIVDDGAFYTVAKLNSVQTAFVIVSNVNAKCKGKRQRSCIRENESACSGRAENNKSPHDVFRKDIAPLSLSGAWRSVAVQLEAGICDYGTQRKSPV